MPEQTTQAGPKYPAVKVRLVGLDGNAFCVIARCRDAARKNCVPAPEISRFIKEAMSGDYDHVLTTCLKWFTCR